jgi:hypothetical protein
MQTKYPLFLVLAIAGATLIWVGSGMGATYGVNDPIGSDSPAADELQKQVGNSSVSENGSFDASSRRTTDGGLVGMIVTGSQFAVTFGQIVLFLPAQLQTIGLPGYVAGPIGLLAQAMVAFGVVQFLANRRYD